jgi:hypothetical protein
MEPVGEEGDVDWLYQPTGHVASTSHARGSEFETLSWMDRPAGLAHEFFRSLK